MVDHPRGEVYAVDLDARRYVRLTHSDHRAAGALPSADGRELVVVGFDRVELPAGADAAPLLTSTWIETYDTTTWKRTGARAKIGRARKVAVEHGPGGQLRVTTYPAVGRWGVGPATVAVLDRGTGKLTPTTVSAAAPTRLVVSLDEAVVEGAAAGVQAAWAGEPQAASELTLVGGKTFAVPESGRAARAAVAVSPDGARLALVTLTDPCAAAAPAPSLYIGDGATGQLRHVLTARARFAMRWLDVNRLLYQDADGALRVWDAAAGREVAKLESRPGLAVDGLSAIAMAPCPGAAPPPEAAGVDADADAPPDGDGETDADDAAPVATP
ncbi:MAG: hypothetical protein R2939_22670 [Kofleriaceae bacterium]